MPNIGFIVAMRAEVPYLLKNATGIYQIMESFAVAQTAAKYQIPAIIIKAVSDIVPKHASLISLLNLVRSLKINSKKARARLSMNVNKIIEDQDLIG